MNKLLVFGGSGMVGSRFVTLQSDKFEIVSPTSSEVDLTKPDQIIDIINQLKPMQILYAAGFTSVDLAEEQSELCYTLNVKAIEIIATEAKKIDAPTFYLSTDYVFDGKKNDLPYTEADTPNPLDSVYSKSKLEGEKVVLSASQNNGVLRLIMPFSANFDKKLDIARLVVNKLAKGEPVAAITDQKINPILVDDLVSAIATIVQNNRSGIYHLGATDYTTPFDFVEKLARGFNLDEGLVSQTSFAEFSQTRKAPRPQNSWLDVSKFEKEFGNQVLHTIDEEIAEFANRFKVLTD